MKFIKKKDPAQAAAKGATKPPAAKAAAEAGNALKSNLIPAAVIAVGLLGGGFFMGQGGNAPAPEQAQAAEGGESSGAGAEGPVHKLEPITLNLADGHFLKIGLALQAAPAAEAAAEGEEEAEMPEGETAKALDATVDLFGHHTMDQLKSPAVRDKAKAELSKRVNEAYHGEIEKVYFTEFVMQ